MDDGISFKNKNIIFIDDAVTSGGMIKAAKEKLLAEGVSRFLPFAAVLVEAGRNAGDAEMALDTTIITAKGFAAVKDILRNAGNVITSRLVRVLSQFNAEDIKTLAEELSVEKVYALREGIVAYYGKEQCPAVFSTISSQAIADRLSQSQVFEYPQMCRDLILKHVKIKPASAYRGKSDLTVFNTKYCPVGCAHCYFDSRPGNGGIAEDNGKISTAGTAKIIEFSKHAHLGLLAVSGGGGAVL